MFVSPTEPAALRDRLPDARVSLLSERFGADVMWTALGRKWLVQRKEVKDLLSSAGDGRLVEQIRKMAGQGQAVLIVEGPVSWTTDGAMVGQWGSGRNAWTIRRWWGLLWAVRAMGVWVERTRDIAETAQMLVTMEEWSHKVEHGSLSGGRPAAQGIWGTRPDDADWQAHFLTGLPGVGPKTAESIVKAWGGLPFALDERAQKLESVEGIGKKKAADLRRLFKGVQE